MGPGSAVRRRSLRGQAPGLEEVGVLPDRRIAGLPGIDDCPPSLRVEPAKDAPRQADQGIGPVEEQLLELGSARGVRARQAPTRGRGRAPVPGRAGGRPRGSARASGTPSPTVQPRGAGRCSKQNGRRAGERIRPRRRAPGCFGSPAHHPRAPGARLPRRQASGSPALRSGSCRMRWRGTGRGSWEAARGSGARTRLGPARIRPRRCRGETEPSVGRARRALRRRTGVGDPPADACRRR